MDRGGAVDVDQLEFPVERRLVEEAVGAEAGVVDQDVEPMAVGGQGLAESLAFVGVGEVGDEGGACDVVRALDGLGDGVEAVGAAGHEGEVVSARGELARDLLADTAGGAGHHGQRTRGSGIGHGGCGGWECPAKIGPVAAGATRTGAAGGRLSPLPSGGGPH